MGITCYMVRPTARFMYWHQSTMARASQMAIRSPQHKCPNQGTRWGRSAAVPVRKWHEGDDDGAKRDVRF